MKPLNLLPIENLVRLLVSSASLAIPALAGNVWDGGGGNDDWGTGANWSPDGSPAPGGSNVIRFAGNSRLTPYNNYTSYDDWQQIHFDAGAGAFTLNGNAIDLYWKIENYSSAAQTVNLAAISLQGSVGEFNPINGNLNITSPNIYTNGKPVAVYGNNGHTLSIGGVISGGGGLTVHQNSTVVLSGANSYTGATSVNAGKLVVNGSTSTGSVTVAGGATLAGTGTIGGNTTVHGTHAVGAAAGGVGTQQVAGDLSYAADSVFSWDLNANSTSTGFDVVDRTTTGGSVSVNSSSAIRIVIGGAVAFTDAFWNSNRTWTWSSIFTDFSTVGSFANFTVVNGEAGAAHGSFSVDGMGVRWSAVPEPGGAGIGLLVVCGMLRRRRKGRARPTPHKNAAPVRERRERRPVR